MFASSHLEGFVENGVQSVLFHLCFSFSTFRLVRKEINLDVTAMENSLTTYFNKFHYIFLSSIHPRSTKMQLSRKTIQHFPYFRLPREHKAKLTGQICCVWRQPVLNLGTALRGPRKSNVCSHTEGKIRPPLAQLPNHTNVLHRLRCTQKPSSRIVPAIQRFVKHLSPLLCIEELSSWEKKSFSATVRFIGSKINGLWLNEK